MGADVTDAVRKNRRTDDLRDHVHALLYVVLQSERRNGWTFSSVWAERKSRECICAHLSPSVTSEKSLFLLLRFSAVSRQEIRLPGYNV
jgi:hypothetical protein